MNRIVTQTSLVLVLASLVLPRPLSAQLPADADATEVARPTAPEGVEAPAEEVPAAEASAPTPEAAAATSEAADAEETEAEAEPPHATLDYSDGSFYFRAINDNIVLVPSGRMHIDTYGFSGAGVSDYHRANGTGLRANIFFRRFVIEMGGLIRKKWFFWVGGNFAPTSVDGSQNPVSTANVYDGFIGYTPSPRLKIYFGQYNAPFTLENVTSSRWLDLMERSLTVRTLATPYNKADGLTFWGDTAHGHFEYQVGVFGGDGMNRPNVDNRFDMMSRFIVRPLASRTDALRRFHVGVGARAGSRDPRFVQYDAPAMTTPGGYAYWSPSYTDTDSARVHVRPAGRQVAASAEMYLPFERFDVRGEVVYLNENRSEVRETDRMLLRRGTLSGVGAYAQVSLWLMGAPRINGNPGGSYGVTRLPDGLGAQSPMALQLVLRGELIRTLYNADARSGADAGGLSANTNHIRVNAYQIGLNYWATKHVRLTAEYSLYQFPGSAQSNQAVAPGVRAGTAPGANVLNEFSVRVGLAL